MLHCLILLLTSFLVINSSLAEESTQSSINLLKQVDPQKHAVAGDWQMTEAGLQTDAITSSRITLPYQPTQEYDFEVEFTRKSGVHSIAIIFVMGERQASFEVDAWGQHLAGLQMIDNRSIQQNETRTENMTLQNGRKYKARLEVRSSFVKAYLDDQLIADYKTEGSNLSLPDVWRMPQADSLGLGAYQAETLFHSAEVRLIPDGKMLLAKNSVKTEAVPPSATIERPAMMKPAETKTSSGKRVLIVIANQDFFYREYHDPRQALEQAGIQVEVAAGRKQMCYPHANSGQQGSGAVMPDFAIAEVDSRQYDAIMFSGGWGSSMYQYAFEGSYHNAVYNGDSQIKAAVNRLLNEFIQQDKYVGALCHGVSVLAWARVNNRSILQGRRAVGSPRQSPSGIYNGRRDQPLSRWNAEVNGARLTPIRSIGNPGTSADDVLVDGKLITGEDDNSALLFGQTLARLLTDSQD